MKRRGPSGTGSFETEFFAEYLPRGSVLCPSFSYSSRMISNSVWLVVVVRFCTSDCCGKGGGDGADDGCIRISPPRTASSVSPANELLRLFNADI